MSMSFGVTGIREAGDDWKAKRAALEALVKAEVKPPDELLRYFDPYGDASSILKDNTCGLEVEVPSVEGRDDYRTFVDVDMKSIPQGVKTLRFYISY